jgi:hypothetical protein
MASSACTQIVSQEFFMRLKFSLLVTGFCLVTLLGASRPAQATIAEEVYTFTGTCSDCTGVGTGTLILRFYTPGTELTAENFVDFTYTSNLFPASSPFEVNENDPGLFAGGELGSTTGSYDVEFGNNKETFFSVQSDGDGGSNWCLGTGVECESFDFGPTHTWTLADNSSSPVPEPATGSLVGLGLAGLGLVRRRFQK